MRRGPQLRWFFSSTYLKSVVFKSSTNSEARSKKRDPCRTKTAWQSLRVWVTLRTPASCTPRTEPTRRWILPRSCCLSPACVSGASSEASPIIRLSRPMVLLYLPLILAAVAVLANSSIRVGAGDEGGGVGSETGGFSGCRVRTSLWMDIHTLYAFILPQSQGSSENEGE